MPTIDLGRYTHQGNGAEVDTPAESRDLIRERYADQLRADQRAALEGPIRSQTVMVGRAPARRPRRRRVTHHAYLIRRLPNWRAVRWLIGQGNAYLARTGSGWRLWMRYRGPIPGTGITRCYRDLRCHQARALSVYLKRADRRGR